MTRGLLTAFLNAISRKSKASPMARKGQRDRRKAVAYKAFALAPHLSATDKAVGAVLINAYNLKTGRCDLGIMRIACLTRTSERNVRRSIKKLNGGKYIKGMGYQLPVLIKCHKHGGRYGTNRYEPMFETLEEIVQRFDERASMTGVELEELKRNKREQSKYPAPSTYANEPSSMDPDQAKDRNGHSVQQTRPDLTSNPDKAVRQNHLVNHFTNQFGVKAERPHAVRQRTQPHWTPTGLKANPSHRSVAEAKANTRLWQDCRTTLSEDDLAVLVSKIDEDMERAAVEAETRKCGSGILRLLESVNWKEI